MERLVVLVTLFIKLCSMCRSEGTDTLRCTKRHEVIACMYPCPAELRCDNRHYPLPCAPPTEPCEPQCICADGYARTPPGVCITLAQCDKCKPDDTQYFACNGDYDENCKGACYCNPGFERNCNKTCVPIKPDDSTVYYPPPLPPVPVETVQPPQNPGPVDQNACQVNPNDPTGPLEPIKQADGGNVTPIEPTADDPIGPVEPDPL